MNTSNCHLLKMDSIRGFSRILSKFYTIRYITCQNFQNTYFREHLLMAAFTRFGNTSKWLLLSSLSNRAIFFSKYCYLKNHPKKQIPSFSLQWWTKIPSLLFIMLSWLLFTSALKNFPHLSREIFNQFCSKLTWSKSWLRN